MLYWVYINLNEGKYIFEKFRKLGNKGIYLSIAFIIILFAIIWGILSINTGEKTPVESQRVYEEIINLGYEPIDTTSLYIEDDSNLQKSVTIDNKKIRFDFFKFDNDNTFIGSSLIFDDLFESEDNNGWFNW